MIFFLDNGHGKYQPGKRSSSFIYNGKTVIFEEWKFNMNIVNTIIHINEQHNSPLMLFNVSPNPQHLGQWLKGRVNIANNIYEQFCIPEKRSALFLSIHANAASLPWSSAHGFESYYYAGNEHAKHIAETFTANIVQNLNMKNRGTKANEKFYVLRKTKMDSVLLECGFYTHKEEVKRLYSSEFQKNLSKTIFETLLEIAS